VPDTLPIFPLQLVLFPGARVPLQIFEARYLDLVSRCLSTDSGFGVCLIKSGREVGQPAEPASVGTGVRIVDWQRNPNGLLGITILGQRRFRLLATHVRPDNLIHGDIQWLDDDDAVAVPVPETFRSLHSLLARHLDRQAGTAGADWMKDAAWLGYRLAELIPASQQVQQQLLEMAEPLTRLTYLQQMLES